MLQRVGHRAQFAVANRVGDVGDHGHRLVLQRSHLAHQGRIRRARSFELGEPVVELVVLAQDPGDRRFVLREQRDVGEVHLSGQRRFTLLRESHQLVRLVEQPALVHDADDRLQSRQRHHDEQRRDDQERCEELGVDRRTDAGDPAHHAVQERALLHDVRELFQPRVGGRTRIESLG
ncbi:MAG TPA: hypothetical protein VF428_06070 [Casimicrobiaceae bacterium]